MVAVEVLFKAEHVPPLQEQSQYVANALRCFHEDNGRDPRCPGWVGIWWNEKRGAWLIGCLYTITDRSEALVWYDNQYKTPARLFFVKAGRGYLRAAKITCPRVNNQN